jgi:hypothetical protein
MSDETTRGRPTKEDDARAIAEGCARDAGWTEATLLDLIYQFLDEEDREGAIPGVRDRLATYLYEVAGDEADLPHPGPDA